MGFFRLSKLNPIYRACISNSKSRSYAPKNLNVYQPIQILNIFSLETHDHSFALPDSRYTIPKRWHVGHSHQQHEHYDRSTKEGEKIFHLGLAADICLATGKALTGYVSGSTAIIADAAHSISDVVLSGVALLSFKAARVPQDKEHPYGHGKFETLGALGISLMLLGTAGGIAWHALDLFMGLMSQSPEIVDHHHGIDMAHPILALSVTILAIFTKEGLYWITKRAGEREGSGLMKANAWHHRADAVSSLVALIGVGGSILGVKFLDPLAGIVVSGMILKAGLENGYQSILELVDAAVPLEELLPYKQTILQVEGVKGCSHLRGRRAGSFLHLDVNIEVDPFCSVSAAHDIAESVRSELQKQHPHVLEIFLHVEPATSLLVDESMGGEYETEEEKHWHNNNRTNSAVAEHKEIEDKVRNIILCKFSEKMAIERITRHLLPEKMVLQMEVTMPDDILVGEGIKVAEEAEKEISKSLPPDSVQICIQLRLGNSMPALNKFKNA
ncbi:metal tolerance protein 2 [Impatiens glandulifera]|uniref:metal tolerance protein 2 n=1 Tax=Impatiens glandulifera TaxID=253017 RepID=UPI001FB140E0|nr:metal tolerance protein 2 [Impatiens glandulifera]